MIRQVTIQILPVRPTVPETDPRSGPVKLTAGPIRAASMLAVILALLLAAIPVQAQTVVATVPVGQIPQSIAVNPVTNKIYVANLGSGDITVIDGVTDSTITLTDPNANFLQTVVVNPVTNMIYVANFNSNNVTVIDGATNAITSVADPSANGPNEVAVNPVTNKIYVANWLSDTVTVIDGATNSTLSVPTGTNPHFIAVNTVTNMIYVPNWGSGDVTVIDGSNNSSVTVKDPNASVASNAVVNTATNKIYVSNYGSNNVTVIDGSDNSITTVTDPNAVHPSVVALNQLTNKIYIVNGGSGPYAGSDNVTVIDGATNSTTTVADPNAKDADCVVLDPVTNKIYVSNWASNNITVIDGATNSIETISDPNAVKPNQMAVDSTTQRIYVANGGGFPYGGSNNVTVIAESNLTATSTGLASNLNPAVYGQSVTFTATVSSASGTPTGTVQFYNGSVGIGSGTLANGKTSISVSSLPAGSDSITATYQGSTTFASSTSAPVNQVVNGISTSTGLTSSLNPSGYGQLVTLTATVSSTAGTPTGSINFYNGSAMIGSGTLSGGKTSISTSSLPAGSDSITAAYQGSAAFAASASAPVNQVVNAATTSTGLTSSLNPAGTGQSITFTASVTSQYGGATTGSVTFSSGSQTLGTASLSGGAAALSTSFSSEGTYSITGHYNGDSNNVASTSAPLSQKIIAFTTTSLTSSLNPSTAGQSITFTAKVTSNSATPPNGETVTFYSGSAALGSGALRGGVASLITSSLSAGIHSITASYAGDANFAASTSAALRQIVNSTSKSATSTTIASSLNPSIYGQNVTWTATVKASGSVPPTGKVNFVWSGYNIGTAALNASGVATLTRSKLNADTYPLTAVYVGDANNLGSTSSVLSQVITLATSAAALTSSPNPSGSGVFVTFTATITSPTFTPTGPVTFTAGKTVLGTAELSGGKAKFTTSTLAAGSTKVTATYAGDSNVTGSSAAVTQVVQ